LPSSLKKPTGNRRVTGKEQFYTPRHVALEVVEQVLGRFSNARELPWLEPGGGTGAFLDAYERAGISRFWSCDIEPRDPRVHRGDFLTLAPPFRDCVTATNPPFGRNNALSVPFFNRAAAVSSYIAFIVPRSWRKWSVVNRLHASFHLCLDDDLPIDYENADGRPAAERGGNLQTCMQLWERRDEVRKPVVVEDRGYIKRSSASDADVSLTIFGRGCGTVRTEFPRVPNTTQMFLQVARTDVVDALRSVNFAQFSKNVAYTEALSIQEIRFLLNEFFDGS
jgi:hypothetical protein